MMTINRSAGGNGGDGMTAANKNGGGGRMGYKITAENKNGGDGK
jgi:hypothetical protein